MADPVDGLGAFPIIQAAVAGVITIGGAIAAWRGLVSKTRHRTGEGVEWFFDGPIAKALDTLQSIYRETVEGRKEQQKFADERNKKMDDQTEILRDIREGLTRERPVGRRRRL